MAYEVVKNYKGWLETACYNRNGYTIFVEISLSELQL